MAFAWTNAQGFSAEHKVALLSLYTSALSEAGSLVALATAKPKLAATYEWFMAVQSLALSGNQFFPKAPFPFVEVISE